VISKTLRLVSGNAIRARHVYRDILAGPGELFRGKMHDCAKVLTEIREQAIDRIVLKAENLGANGTVNVQCNTSVVMAYAAEMIVYGSAQSFSANQDNDRLFIYLCHSLMTVK
jgi:uncharacterized protein YbjQ (UPF0145 family)